MWLRLGVAAVLVVASGCTTGSEASAPTATEAASQTQTESTSFVGPVREFLDENQEFVPGIVALVRRGSETKTLTYGVADVPTKEPMTQDHRFRIGSITKSMVATVVLQLVDEGELSLTDTVGPLLPGLLPKGGSITMEQLLSHSSGLPNYIDVANVRHLYYSSNEPAELVAHVSGLPLDFAPGTSAAYSNTNYIVLGMVIEKVTGMSLEDTLETRIFEPLSMTDTSLRAGDSLKGPIARGFEDGDDVTSADPSWIWAAGGIVSTADDVSLFFLALLDARLTSPESLKQMLAPRDAVVPAGGPYGLGIERMETDCGTAYGHHGSVPGYTADAWTMPGKDRQVVVLVNTSDLAVSGVADPALNLGLCPEEGAR